MNGVDASVAEVPTVARHPPCGLARTDILPACCGGLLWSPRAQAAARPLVWPWVKKLSQVLLAATRQPRGVMVKPCASAHHAHTRT